MHDLTAHAALVLRWPNMMPRASSSIPVLNTNLSDGEDIERWMVNNGWALAYVHYSRKYEAKEHTARDAQAGL